jgi:2-phospho-L-lactate guanylyltransferase
MPKTSAVLPIKSFDRAKQRLAERVGAPERATLAAAMVGDVLEALGAVRGLDAIFVVTAEPHAAAAAADAGLRVIDDPDEAGHSEAAVLGVAAALHAGAERVLLVPGDCPALDAAEVDRLLARDAARAVDAPERVVIVADRHGSGTNALLLTPPAVMSPSFGPGSLARHAGMAAAAGADVRVAGLRSLQLDVDTPGDLAALRTALGGLPGAAPRTRALLTELARAAA